ncbi:MAG: alkaline phosphatase [Bacteroidales bacterium]|nr:alkaline phosphatase [Bacteroidales bacterium]
MYMSKNLTLLLAVLCLALPLSAQNREVIASSGDTYAERQGSYTPSFTVDGKNAKIRNVILLIGDGMGQGAVNAAMYANGGELTMTNLRHFGYVRTQSANNFTTDSAASGTAYASGQKTRNGYLGVDTAKVKIPNIPEILAPLGYACGVLSTDNLNGATPAAFFAHQPARGMKEEIWGDLPGSSLTFASAGTQTTFDTLPFRLQEAIQNTFSVIRDPSDPAVAGSKRLLYLPRTVSAERGDYLPATTQMAIDYLSARAKKGFFLMVEGARIDKCEHDNDFAGTVRETLDFDKAVEAAIRFAEQDGHTLVIISADHETGATILSKGDPAEGYVQGIFASKGHTPMMVPLFAYGPRSGEFSCIQENSDVANKILRLLGGKK